MFVAIANVGLAQLAFIDGNAVQTLWYRRRHYLVTKWKTKPRRHRPARLADPPLRAASVPPPIELNIVQHHIHHPVRVQAVAPVQPPTPPLAKVTAPPFQADDSAPQNSTPGTPDSPDTIACGSPLYVARNYPRNKTYRSPTKGQRAFVDNDMKEQGWKFVSILYQLGFGSSSTGKDPATKPLHPPKNVLLYVRPDDTGQIQDVSSTRLSDELTAKVCISKSS
jgi:hypothetical protein